MVFEEDEYPVTSLEGALAMMCVVIFCLQCACAIQIVTSLFHASASKGQAVVSRRDISIWRGGDDGYGVGGVDKHQLVGGEPGGGIWGVVDDKFDERETVDPVIIYHIEAE